MLMKNVISIVVQEDLVLRKLIVKISYVLITYRRNFIFSVKHFSIFTEVLLPTLKVIRKTMIPFQICIKINLSKVAKYFFLVPI